MITEIKPLRVMSKFPARLENCSLSPNNYWGSKCQSTLTQFEMSLLHCDKAVETTLTYILFFFSFFLNHSFSSLQTEVHDN